MALAAVVAAVAGAGVVVAVAARPPSSSSSSARRRRATSCPRCSSRLGSSWRGRSACPPRCGAPFAGSATGCGWAWRAPTTHPQVSGACVHVLNARGSGRSDPPPAGLPLLLTHPTPPPTAPTYSPGEAEALALDERGKPLLSLLQCCVEERRVEGGADGVVRHTARAATPAALAAEMVAGGVQSYVPACSPGEGGGMGSLAAGTLSRLWLLGRRGCSSLMAGPTAAAPPPLVSRGEHEGSGGWGGGVCGGVLKRASGALLTPVLTTLTPSSLGPLCRYAGGVVAPALTTHI